MPQDFASSKIQAATADNSVVSALLLSVVLQYIFELPAPVEQCDKKWVKILFLFMMWTAVTAYMGALFLTGVLNAALNFWIREADLQAMLYRGGTAVNTMIIRLSFFGAITTWFAALVSSTQMKQVHPYGAILMPLFFLPWIIYSGIPGVALMRGSEENFLHFFKHGFFTYRRGLSPYGVFYDNAAEHLAEIKGNVPTAEREKDLMDVPLDVFRTQAKLGELFDEDTWRSGQITQSLTEDMPYHSNHSNPIHDSSSEEKGTEESSLKGILKGADPSYASLYCSVFVESKIKTSQLKELTRQDLVEYLRVPLGDAIKMMVHFREMASE